MAGKLPRHTLRPGRAVGYGRKGNAFKSVRNFNIAKAMAKKAGRPGPTRFRKIGGMPKFGTHRKKV